MKLVRWLRGEGEFVHASVGEQSFIRNAGRVNCLHFKRVRAAARAACANLIVWDGRQRRIAYRWGENKIDRVPELAADLVRRKVAVMLATGNTAVALTAKAATTTIPILFISGEDPVRLGLVTIQEESVANSTSSIRNTNPQRR